MRPEHLPVLAVLWGVRVSIPSKLCSLGSRFSSRLTKERAAVLSPFFSFLLRGIFRGWVRGFPQTTLPMFVRGRPPARHKPGAAFRPFFHPLKGVLGRSPISKFVKNCPLEVPVNSGLLFFRGANPHLWSSPFVPASLSRASRSFPFSLAAQTPGPKIG